MPTRKKIALIGAGNIGGELASLCARKQLGDVVLFDIPAKENFAKGKALDLEQNGAILGYDAYDHRAPSNWADCAGADVLIVTAGIPRKPGQSRDDLVATNLPIIRDVADNAKKHCPERVRHRDLEPARRDGLRVQARHRLRQAQGRRAWRACSTARASSCFLAREAGVSVKDVRAMVLGGHGDDMVPVLSMTTINGVPVTQLIAKDKLDAIIERTRKGGGEIVNADGHERVLRAGDARAIAMAEAYLLDQKRLLAVRGVPRRRVRLQGPLHGRAGHHRRRGRREDRRDRRSPTRRRACSRRAPQSVQGIVDVVKKRLSRSRP